MAEDCAGRSLFWLIFYEAKTDADLDQAFHCRTPAWRAQCQREMIRQKCPKACGVCQEALPKVAVILTGVKEQRYFKFKFR